MSKGFSVHVGVNKPDPLFQMNELRGCVNDATEMEKIAVKNNFKSLGLFLDDNAMFPHVQEAILQAAGDLEAGDIFLFTFAGHGSTESTSDVLNEPDRHDETILLHDCLLIDNYVRRVWWSKFAEGVRILGVADCCHSGSALHAFFFNSAPPFFGSFPSLATITAGFGTANMLPLIQPNGLAEGAAVARPRVRGFTNKERETIIERRHDIHSELMNELLTDGKEPKATILTLAACRDNEDALDGETNGAFTGAMLEVLQGQNPPGNYNELMTRIKEKLEAKNITQHPTRFPKEMPDLAFLSQSPFSIGPP